MAEQSDLISPYSCGDRTKGTSDDINDNLLKTLESDLEQMQSEVKQKDMEIERLFDELMKKNSHEQNDFIIRITEGYEDTIKTLEERIKDLETSCEHSKDELDQAKRDLNKYFKAIASLEQENERLRDENKRQSNEIQTLGDKVNKITKISNVHNMSMSIDNRGYNSTTQKKRMSSNNDRQRHLSVLDINPTDLDDNLSTNETFLDFGGTPTNAMMKDLKSNLDEIWYEKLDLIKEKLIFEQNKNRELEFLVVNQKNALDTLQENLTRSIGDKRELETRVDSMKKEHDKMNELCMQEKMKMDSVVTFCSLMENYSLDPNIKLPDFPSIISNYLRGVSQNISMTPTSGRSPEMTNRKGSISATTGTRLLKSKGGIYEHEGMKVLRDDVDALKTFYTKMIQSNDQSALRAVEQESRSPSRDHREQEELKKLQSQLERQKEFERQQQELDRLKELERLREIERLKEQELKREAEKANATNNTRTGTSKDPKDDSAKKKKQNSAAAVTTTGRGRLFVGSSFYLAQAVQNSNGLFNAKKGGN
jgi:hypothetical protein